MGESHPSLKCFAKHAEDVARDEQAIGQRAAIAVLYAREGACALMLVQIGDRDVGYPADKHPKQAEKLGSGSPMNRTPAQPEETAPPFVFSAASLCSSYVTGKILPVIGSCTGG